MRTHASPLLNLYRRHSSNCPGRRKGQNYLKCTCPIWAYGESGGRIIRHSMGTRDWGRATRKLGKLENPEAPSKPTAEAIAAFLQHCRELAASTQRKYGNVMRHFQAFCAGQQINTLDELTVDALDHYRADRGIGRVTGLKELQTLRQFCAFCVDREWMKHNVAKKVKAPKNVRPVPVEPYTASEVQRIIAACDEIGKGSYERLRARTMVLLLRYTGLRISDVATFGRDRLRDGKILLHTQKTGGTVYLPIPLELQQAIDALPPARNAPFGCSGLFWNGIMSRRAVVGVAERTLAAVFKASKVRGAKAHRFRHTLATEILTRGGTEQDVADVLGISPAIVRKHYAKWTTQRQERISALLKAVHSCTNYVQAENEAVIQ